MKILLSSSVKHFDPKTKTVLIRHSVGVLVELFSQVLERIGEVTYIGDDEDLKGGEFDLLVSWPRNFARLKRNNKFKKTVCFFNIYEGHSLRNALRPEATRLGCKLSDCFVPEDYYDADLNFLIGGPEIAKPYLDRGIRPEKLVLVDYRHGYIPFKARNKNEITTFIHIATTLGLRKGFWHVLKDFENANLDAKLICVGKIQKERFWIDLLEKYKNHPKIKIVGWVPNDSPDYINYIHQSDFIVFPSFGEGQPGSVIEAMEGGCLPIVSKESGIPWYPVGDYRRGELAVYKRAVSMTNDVFKSEQWRMREMMDFKYNNDKFKEIVYNSLTGLLI